MLSLKRWSFRRFWWVFIIVGFFIIGILCIFANCKQVASPSPKNVVIKEAKPKSITSNVLFLGNTYWGRYINDWSMASVLKYEYPFSRLNEFNRDQYDAWVSGLECPTVDGLNITSAEEDSTLNFNCSPDYLPQAAKWFTAFTLANNHTDNQGEDGFTETKAHLEENGIQYFGHYDYKNIDDVCEIISLPVSIAKTDGSKAKGALPVAMCGYHGVFGIPKDEAVAKITEYSSYMPVIAMPHMGEEYKSSPDTLKTNFYHSLIDAGADMVLGDHPHWIQTSESYKGHLIVYSMGNFIFDQQDNIEVTRSAGINVAMTINESDAIILQKWLDIGKTCMTFKDDCLSQIKQLSLKKLSISYKFGVVGTNDAAKIVKPATVEQQTSILQRLDWQDTMSQLQPPYSSL